MMITYQILYSRRKTLAIQVKRDGQVVVRSPFGVPEKQIDGFVSSHKVWIQKDGDCGETQGRDPDFFEEEEKQYRKEPRSAVEENCLVGKDHAGGLWARIAIEPSDQMGAWNSLGNLNYNWKLILLPEPIQDYVVVHELAQPDRDEPFCQILGSCRAVSAGLSGSGENSFGFMRNGWEARKR